MIKFKAKSIENVAERAKERMLGKKEEGDRIGILVSTDNFSGGRNYGLKLAYNVQNTILKNGFETEIIALPTICDNYKEFTSENNFINIYKDQLASMVELILTEKSFDGLVIIAKGISSKMGMLKGAIRNNIPTIVFGEGPSTNGDGNTLKDLTIMAGKVARGKLSSFELQEQETMQLEYVGDGANMNSSNLLSIMLEILGLSVYGNSTTFASTIARENLAATVAKTITSLTKDRFSPRKLVTKKAINNAIVTNFALGGSTIVLDCLLEIAKELEIDITFDKALALQKNIPTLFDTSSNNMTDYAKAGGTLALAKELAKEKLIDESVKTYTNSPLSGMLKETKSQDGFTVVTKEALKEMRGNIAERYGFIKAQNIPEIPTFEGKVKKFESDDTAAYAILSKAVNPNTVIVIKNQYKTFDGGRTPSQTVRALEAFELLDSVVVLTEGNIPDDTKAMVIGNILPCGDDGNLRVLQDDDTVEIDFVKGKINVDLTGKELNQRNKKYIKDHSQNPQFVKQYLKLLSK